MKNKKVQKQATLLRCKLFDVSIRAREGICWATTPEVVYPCYYISDGQRIASTRRRPAYLVTAKHTPDWYALRWHRPEQLGIQQLRELNKLTWTPIDELSALEVLAKGGL